MRRGSKITLYELMSQGADAAESKAVKSADTPARVLRVPMGFAWAGGALLVILMIASYLVGFQRGGRSAEASLVQDQLDTIEADRVLQMTSEVGESAFEPPVSTPRSAGTTSSGPDPTAPTSPSTGVKTASGDPRIAGMNYYVICHPSENKVDGLIRFCARNGLDAHRVSTSTGGAKVIVTPGFPSGGSGSEDILALKARIRSVGILWKQHDRGQNEDFSTYYPEKYRP